jgi:hypothetical protein
MHDDSINILRDLVMEVEATGDTKLARRAIGVLHSLLHEDYNAETDFRVLEKGQVDSLR